MITAPYNFVPLSDKVVMPFWANHVSHDIPFENAQSGTLKVKVTAKSPIFVRNGMPRSANEKDPNRNEFNNIDGRYFIPGSSLKGMIRSVVEIMSYGRMKNKVNDHKYSVRDFQNNHIYPKTDLSSKVECGWLYKLGDVFYIDECGKPGRISHKELDNLCNGSKISSHYKIANNISNDRQKSARSKYDTFKFEKSGHRFALDKEDMGRPIYKIDSPNGRTGTIVLTGQPGVRKEPKEGKAPGKHLEFVFFEPKNINVEVPEDIIKNLFFAYYDHDRNQQKDDWKWRKEQLDKGEKIPVFFRKDSKGKIIDMGLTQLYKITYRNSIIDLINNQQGESDGYDLAETIFGFTEDKKALKGRVHFGHAFMDNQKQPMGIKTEVLAGPKASYYPNYVEQNTDDSGRIKGNYSTYMDKNAKIRGWKRYPVRTGDNTVSNPGTENVATKFYPLPANTEFLFDITYHNLRKEELGALISALTFHNTDGLYHSIGSAKPLGYGKILLEIDGLDENKKKEMLKSYELFMDSQLGNSTPLWFQSLQIKELMAMAKPGKDDKLKYMGLTDFVNAKGRRKNDPKFSLSPYSKIVNNNVYVKSLTTTDELNKIKSVYENEKSILENQEDISSVKNRLLEQTRKDLDNAIEQKKADLLRMLKEKRQTLIQITEEQKAEQEAKRIAEKREKEKEEAAQLVGDIELIFKDDTFKTAQDVLKPPFEQNKFFEYSEDQKDIIIEQLKKCWENDPKAFKRKKKINPFPKFPWSDIINWIGKEKAKELYDELTS